MVQVAISTQPLVILFDSWNDNVSHVSYPFSLWHVDSTDIIWCWLCMFLHDVAWKLWHSFYIVLELQVSRRRVLVKLNYFSEVLFKRKCCADRKRARDIVTVVQQGKARLLRSYKEFFLGFVFVVFPGQASRRIWTLMQLVNSKCM